MLPKFSMSLEIVCHTLRHIDYTLQFVLYMLSAATKISKLMHVEFCLPPAQKNNENSLVNKFYFFLTVVPHVLRKNQFFLI